MMLECHFAKPLSGIIEVDASVKVRQPIFPASQTKIIIKGGFQHLEGRDVPKEFKNDQWE